MTRGRSGWWHRVSPHASREAQRYREVDLSGRGVRSPSLVIDCETRKLIFHWNSFIVEIYVVGVIYKEFQRAVRRAFIGELLFVLLEITTGPSFFGFG